MKSILVLGFAAACLAAHADTNQFTMPLRGVELPAGNFKLVNHIPQERLALLPKRLPVYRYSGRVREFPLAGLQMLLDQSAFAGTNIVSLFPPVGTNQTVTVHGVRLLSQDRLDYFIVSPGEGRIMVKNGERIRGIPPPDAVPSFEIIQTQLFCLAQVFGITTNEMERQLDGSLFLRNRLGENSSFGGAVQCKTSREVEMCRAIPESPFMSINYDRIALELGVDGRLRRFNLTWPPIEVVATNRLLSISEIMAGIQRGRVLSDVMNDYPSGGIAEIELRDIRIEYYVPDQPVPMPGPPKADICPIASMLAAFKSKDGEVLEAGLYAPILHSQ